MIPFFKYHCSIQKSGGVGAGPLVPQYPPQWPVAARPDPAGWRGRQLASLCCSCKDKAFASGRRKGRDAAPSAPGPESKFGRVGHSSQLQRGVCRAPPPPSSHSPPPLVLSRACWAGRAACRPGLAHARRRPRPRAAADGPLASACSEAASVAATGAGPPSPSLAGVPVWPGGAQLAVRSSTG